MVERLQRENEESIKWHGTYHKRTKSLTRVMEFQFKFLHRRLPTNEFRSLKLEWVTAEIVPFIEKKRKNCSTFFGHEPKLFLSGKSLIARADRFCRITPVNYTMHSTVALGLRHDSSFKRLGQFFVLFREISFTVKWKMIKNIHNSC